MTAAINEPSVLMSNYGVPPVEFRSGSGTELFDTDGKRYLDFLCGLAVTSLGHAHPALTEAISAQAARLTHVSNLFANEYQVDVAATIDRLVRFGREDTSDPGQILFQNSGAETIEASLKLARKFQGRGRHGVIAAQRSFHGRTLMALAATGQPEKHEPFQPLPEGFRHVEFGASDVLEAAIAPEVGTVLLETVQGEGGVHPATAQYLQDVRYLCDEHGMTLVIDEVQTGLGRTGQWFGFQHAGIVPDIVAMAKALGNGFPVGAVWATREVAAAFGPGAHGSTFAGQPLALAAAKATLQTMIDMDAPAVVRAKEQTLRDLLGDVSGVHHVRGQGLLLAAELTETALGGRTGAEVARACLDAGVIVNGVTPTALRLAPPFIVTDAELAEGVAIIESILENS